MARHAMEQKIWLDPLAGLKPGPTSKGRLDIGREGKGRGREGRGRRGEGKVGKEGRGTRVYL